jgi:hypothetical protein
MDNIGGRQEREMSLKLAGDHGNKTGGTSGKMPIYAVHHCTYRYLSRRSLPRSSPGRFPATGRALKEEILRQSRPAA